MRINTPVSAPLFGTRVKGDGNNARGPFEIGSNAAGLGVQTVGLSFISKEQSVVNPTLETAAAVGVSPKLTALAAANPISAGLATLLVGAGPLATGHVVGKAIDRRLGVQDPDLDKDN